LLAALPSLIGAGCDASSLAIICEAGMQSAMETQMANATPVVPKWSYSQFIEATGDLGGNSLLQISGWLKRDICVLCVRFRTLAEEMAVSSILLRAGALSVQFHDLSL
jgi:hypothetical protein